VPEETVELTAGSLRDTDHLARVVDGNGVAKGTAERSQIDE
jgi:hypothetical protein